MQVIQLAREMGMFSKKRWLNALIWIALWIASFAIGCWIIYMLPMITP